MSCSGCRVLRRGCKENCTLRPCLEWIQSPRAQANATMFLSKFFGRSDLISFISAVPENERPALFQSLMFEACGRTVNPIGGAVGLLTTGNWHICQAAVDTVLAGGELQPLAVGITAPAGDRAPVTMDGPAGGWGCVDNTVSFGGSDFSEVSGSEDNGAVRADGEKPNLLNLFR
ncbi:LOB domain-containing protein [Striga asiatica]|uniref:LOB domain-containing protein n=1 Tax=Striga asiatica TaxID=4170 RepID=A0A5A7R402_STRAF|nr:LOB domain-containing protein [Striga asiatica]